MAADVEVGGEGLQQLTELSRRLKATGQRDLKNELSRSIRASTKETRDEIKKSALNVLPARGGLAKLVSKSSLRTSGDGLGRNPGVRIVASNKHEIAAMNRGRLRHPIFGNRGKWRTQEVKTGWFSDPIEKDAPRVREAIEKAVKDIGSRIERQ